VKKWNNPYHRFMLLLGGLTVLSSIVLTIVLSFVVEKNVLKETEKITREGIEIHFKTLFSNMFHHKQPSTNQHSQLKKMVSMHFDLYRIEDTRFIDPSGEIHFSYDKNEIGTFLSNDDEPLKKVLLNRIAVKNLDSTHLQMWVPILDEEGNVEQVAFVNRDISTQLQSIRHIQLIATLLIVLIFFALYISLRKIFLQSTQEVKKSEEKYRLIAENTTDLIEVLDVSGIIQYASPSHEANLGFSPTSYINHTIFDFIHPDDVVRVHKEFHEFVLTTTTLHIEFRYKHRDGDWVFLEAHGRLVIDEDEEVQAIVVDARDITEQKRAEETIYNLAYHDSLTHLPNRRFFLTRLHTALEQAKNDGAILTIMFIDIDGLKKINDTLGHSIGDCLLRNVSERLTHCVRNGDMVARIGGDEFTVLLPHNETVDEGLNVAQNILDAFAQPFELEGHELHVSLSIGISSYPDHGETAEILIKRADAAMYYTKSRMKNNYEIYSEYIDSHSLERLVIENDMRKAIKQNQFQLFYQPKVNSCTGEIIGMEALVRWNHPQRGMISPANFIEIAEETGMIVPLGKWILRTACKQNKEWQDKGYSPFRMAVNLSARQFKRGNLIETITSVLTETGMAAKWLELEITESAIMDSVQDTVDTLNHLKNMGVQVSIDDFGTGYSSLSYLKKLPIDTLKIDQSFVRDLPIHLDDIAIVTAIISMARNLNLHVIAEGVETEEQLSFLQENGCDEIQGYLISKPVPSKEMEKMLEKQPLIPLGLEILK
jgi:diguanylate cyclase (GGDEF)-like protein/PAS domain S-box-containing protein